ncbi:MULTISPECIES: thiamine-phosphate kinase [unclassified Brenneria]|uniref:thiamine-phosphate kinase n=1 Tax=unclassified Brenneria TaxID=2634434 RepID=UPI0018F0E883|nr:thiamine-phosphate kinase [Brenneria sp. L3-3C-1]MBJ7224164.1 thiamine-monophosphate kinase [Brenneria sp. L3-3C-1]MEE3645409.1 thiamine-phosphate kinase [Brenneria sp. L3_3C_1]
MLMHEIGEKSFLRSLLPRLNKSDSFLNGFGNDASIVDIGLPDIAIAFKIDRAAKPIAAYKGWTDFQMWGRLAVTANLSDILAVGATPTGFMLSITVPGNWKSSDVEAIVAGAANACKEKGVAFVGGDTKEGGEANVVGAAFGTIKKDAIVSRRSAEEGDTVLLAGRLGGFASAYLLRSKAAEENTEILQSLSLPTCAWDEARYLFSHGGVTAAVDLSDGIADGLSLLSKHGFAPLINIDSFPLHHLAKRASNELNIDKSNFAFTVGDWGILFSMSEKAADSAISSIPDGLDVTKIGTIVKADKPRYRSFLTGTDYELTLDLKNEHFRRTMEKETDYFSELTEFSFLKEKI